MAKKGESIAGSLPYKIQNAEYLRHQRLDAAVSMSPPRPDVWTFDLASTRITVEARIQSIAFHPPSAIDIPAFLQPVWSSSMNPASTCYTIVHDDLVDTPSTQDLRNALQKGSDEVKLETMRKIIVGTLNGQSHVSGGSIRGQLLDR